MLVPWPPMILRRRVQHDVGAPLDRPAEVRRRERVVDEQRHAVLVRDARNRLDVEHVAARVADRLAEESFRVVAHRAAPGSEIVGIHPRDLHAHLAQHVLQLIDGAAVERGRRDDVIARREQREQRRGLRREPARERDGAAAALEARDALLEHRDRRIHDPRVRVAVLLQVEIRGRGFRILEHVARRLVDRHGACARIRVRALPRVHLARVEAEVA